MGLISQLTGLRELMISCPQEPPPGPKSLLLRLTQLTNLTELRYCSLRQAVDVDLDSFADGKIRLTLTSEVTSS